MLLAPHKRHSSQRQSTPEPAPERWCTLRPHLLLLRLSSSLVSVDLALSTPACNTHVCMSQTKTFIQDWILPFELKTHTQIILIPVTMRPLGDQGGSCQVVCNMDSISHLQRVPEQHSHKPVHSNYSCCWGCLPPTARKDQQAGNGC